MYFFILDHCPSAPIRIQPMHHLLWVRVLYTHLLALFRRATAHSGRYRRCVLRSRVGASVQLSTGGTQRNGIRPLEQALIYSQAQLR